MTKAEKMGNLGRRILVIAQTFYANSRGATAIEYALIAGGISIAIVVAVNTLGVNLTGLFSSVKPAFE